MSFLGGWKNVFSFMHKCGMKGWKLTYIYRERERDREEEEEEEESPFKFGFHG
jgi:hypothetical protein